jgi:hypothetical protein
LPSEKAIRRGVANLSLMKFQSGDEDTRAALSQALEQICSTDEQVDKLTEHMPRVFPEWPGVYELRACACSMFKPKDGVNADSARYPEGIPTPRELKHPELLAIPPAARRLDLPIQEQIKAARQLAAGNQRSIEAGTFTVDESLQDLVREMAAATAIPPPKQRRTIAEIEADLYKKHPVK